MNRKELIEYLTDEYGEKPEYLWVKYPTYAVFRHRNNGKWFAVVMTVDKNKIGINENGLIDVVNLKCEASFVPTAVEQDGVYPAYHMNKEHWITVALDGKVNDENLKFLIDLSYRLTDKKKKTD